jgi:hypothetical protein
LSLTAVEGTVIRQNEESVGRSGRRFAPHYYPTVSYYVGSMEYRKPLRDYFFVSHLTEGERVGLLYDPSNPKEKVYLDSIYRFFFPLQRVLLFCVLMMGMLLFVVILHALLPTAEPADSFE